MAVSINTLAKKENFIKENWKPIVGIGAALGVSYMVWSIYSDWKKDNENPTKDLQLKEDTSLPPSELSDAQALLKANLLQEAMGTFGGVNEEELRVIRNVFQGLTYNDYIKLSKFFGERGYITVTGISKDSDFMAPAKNLSYWLSKELKPDDLIALGKIIPGLF